MTWVGDTSEIGRLAARIDRLRSVPGKVKERIAPRIQELIQNQFDAGSDPYGRSWEPLAQSTVDRGRSDPPLTDTHEMRNDLKVRPKYGAVVDIVLPHPAGVHQTGWVGPKSSGPARPILPVGGRMPALWKDVIETEIRNEVKETLR